MFTGLIEDVGKIVEIHSRGNYDVLTITSCLADEHISVGDSIACDGACLTVTDIKAGTFTVEASQETIAKTTINTYQIGSSLNLERALKVGSRLGGHFVTGHIDCTGIIETVRSIGESLEISITYDRSFDNLIIEKGSIAINGISLTVNETGHGNFSVNLIPHTAKATTVKQWKTKDIVNLEFDMIGKYILKINQSSKNNILTKDKLFESGW